MAIKAIFFMKRRKYLRPILKSIQFICGLFGHDFSGDWGYRGGDYADVWCRRCDKFEQVHKTSVWFKNREAKRLMSMVGTTISGEQK